MLLPYICLYWYELLWWIVVIIIIFFIFSLETEYQSHILLLGMGMHFRTTAKPEFPLEKGVDCPQPTGRNSLWKQDWHSPVYSSRLE